MSGPLAVLPSFIGRSGRRSGEFLEAARSVDGPLALDAVAVASMLSFAYVVDGRSLLAQVRRPSLLETVDPAALAGYGRRVMTGRAAASGLLRRLADELERAFAGADRVTLLLSGGLDSRLASTVLVGLARQGKVTDEIRAVTWGIPESRDRLFGERVARQLGVRWSPVELGPADLTRNIDVVATELGALMSPVHLHAILAVCDLDWGPGDKVLVSTLGNGIGRGAYLHRHITYARSIRPIDWLGLLRRDLVDAALSELAHDLDSFRRSLKGRPRVAVHECEMLANVVAGSFLPTFGPLHQTVAPVHQAMSDPATYGFLWSLSPLLRSESTYHTALRLAAAAVTEIPDSITNRRPRRFARQDRNSYSPYMHRYPRWITRDLAERVDDLLSRHWFDATGVFDGAAVRHAWHHVRGQAEPHPPTTYILAWLCAVRLLVDQLDVARRPAPPVTSAPARGPGSDGVPWGCGGREVDPRWRRALALPRQGLNAALCGVGRGVSRP